MEASMRMNETATVQRSYFKIVLTTHLVHHSRILTYIATYVAILVRLIIFLFGLIEQEFAQNDHIILKIEMVVINF